MLNIYNLLKNYNCINFENNNISFLNFITPTNNEFSINIILIFLMLISLTITISFLLKYLSLNKKLILEKNVIENELSITNEQIKNIKIFAENANDLFFVTTNDGYFKFVNPIWTDVLGWSLEEIYSKPIYEFIHPDDIVATRALHKEIPNRYKFKNFENRYKHKDGTYRRLLWTSVTYINEKLKYGVARDITEDKKFQNIFRLSDKYLSEIIKFSPYGIFIFNSDKKLVFCSYALKSIFKIVEEKDINTFNLINHIHEDDKEEFTRYFDDIFHNRKTNTIEFRLLQSNGEYRWFESIFNNQLENYDINAVIVSLRDIHKRKSTEIRLIERESLLTTLFQNAPFQIWVRDKNDIGIFENDLMLKSFNSIIGKTPNTSGSSEETINKWNCNNARVHNGEIINEEITYIENNELKYYKNILAPIIINNKYEGIVGFNIDISEFKNAEESLRKSENIIRTYIENVPFGVWVCDKNGIGILENSLLSENFGSILNQSIIEKGIISKETFEKFLINTNSNNEIINEEQIIYSNGFEKICKNTIIPIFKNGVFDGLAGLKFDITDERQVENFKQSQFNIVRTISSTNDYNYIYEFIHKELSKLIDASNFYIALYDEKRDMLNTSYDKDRDNNYEEWSAKKSLTGLVIQRKKTVFINKNDILDLISNNVIDKIGQLCEVWLGVPLIANDRIIGAIVVQSYDNPNAYNNQSIEILEIIANQLAQFLERKLYEQKLQETIIRLNTIISNIPIVIFSIDNNGIFTFSEGKGLELLGLKPSQVVGLSAFEIYKNNQIIYTNIKNALAGETLHSIIPVDDLYFDTLYSPIYDSFGKVTGIIGVSSDVTERFKATQELELSHKSYKSVFNNISEFIFILNHNIEIIEINDIVIDFYGYSKDELVGKNFTFFSADEMNNIEIIRSYFFDTISGEIPSFEFWTKTKNDEIYPLEIALNSSEYFGEQVIIAVGRNILERKQAEDDLRQAKERAEESDKLKTTFLANMSHEIRTPMNAILGFANLLDAEDLEPDERQEFISLIHKRGHDLLNIINDIIDISKIEANQMTINIDLADINHILNEVLDTYKSLLIDKNVELKIGNRYQNLPYILTDSARLQQIITNLISNAIKFTLNGYIEVGYIINNQNFIEFYVKDTGVGIQEDKIDLIFERFRQSDDNYLTRPYDGAGLGLTISKKLCELIGGNIWVESEYGVGSTFYFTIPYNIQQFS